jgi:site-specific recombinase XerD
MSPLRKQMREAMALRGMAARTQDAYITAVKGLAKYYRRSPEELSPEEVERYLLHLIEERKLSWSTTNQAACAFNFLYGATLKREQKSFVMAYRKTQVKQPEILSRAEVEQILASCRTTRQHALLTTVYAAGLRVAEVCTLRIGDIDSERMMLRVDTGKGGRDRYTLLSPRLLAELRGYWREARPDGWLFPTRDGLRPMDTSLAQKLYYSAKRAAGVTKQGGIHALRHAFATHLLEAGVDVHTIQKLMGHSSVSTTVRYFHLRQTLAETDSPLDLLPAQFPLPEPTRKRRRPARRRFPQPPTLTPPPNPAP